MTKWSQQLQSDTAGDIAKSRQIVNIVNCCKKKRLRKKLPVISDNKWSCCFLTSTWQCLYIQSLGFNQHITITLFSFFFGKQAWAQSSSSCVSEETFLNCFCRIASRLFFFVARAFCCTISHMDESNFHWSAINHRRRQDATLCLLGFNRWKNSEQPNEVASNAVIYEATKKRFNYKLSIYTNESIIVTN